VVLGVAFGKDEYAMLATGAVRLSRHTDHLRQLAKQCLSAALVAIRQLYACRYVAM